MKLRIHEDYYHWCCDWCDSENRTLWARIGDALYCGACHRQLLLGSHGDPLPAFSIAAGLC